MIVKYWRRRTAWVPALVAASVFVFYYVNPVGYASSLGVIDEALEHLSRAETAQTPEGVTEHVMKAQRLLPVSGSVWWSSTDFETIQADLDGIIIRARTISALEPTNEQYIQEMFDIHSDIEAVTSDVIHACRPIYC